MAALSSRNTLMGGWQCKTMLISRWLKKRTFRGDKRQALPDVAYWPSTQLVEKKQMLRVSSGFSCVNSGERVWGSDSPVREELSTFTGRREKREQRHPERLRERVTGWDWQGENERRSTYQQQVQWCNTCHVKSTFYFRSDVYHSGQTERVTFWEMVCKQKERTDWAKYWNLRGKQVKPCVTKCLVANCDIIGYAVQTPLQWMHSVCVYLLSDQAAPRTYNKRMGDLAILDCDRSWGRPHSTSLYFTDRHICAMRTNQ